MAKILIERVAAFGRAISDPNRVLILKILGCSPKDTVRVTDIADILGISQPAATRHLQILHEQGLISRKRAGNVVYYSIDKETVKEFEQMMGFCFERYDHPCEYEFRCEECPHGETCS